MSQYVFTPNGNAAEQVDYLSHSRGGRSSPVYTVYLRDNYPNVESVARFLLGDVQANRYAYLHQDDEGSQCYDLMVTDKTQPGRQCSIGVIKLLTLG